MILSKPLISKTSRIAVEREHSARCADRCRSDLATIRVVIADGFGEHLLEFPGVCAVDPAFHHGDHGSILTFDIDFHSSRVSWVVGYCRYNSIRFN